MSTLVVYSDTTDGFLFSEDSFGTGYSAARDGTGNVGITTDTGTNLRTGQTRIGGATYDVWEAFIAFDTSSLTAGATVSAAVLNLTAQIDSSTTDFTVEARLRDWGTSVDTGDWVAGGGLSALTLLAHYATSGGFVPDTAYDLVNDTFPANVNKTGSTRLILSSNRTTGNNVPTGSEYVTARSADQTGTTQDPKLTVTYSSSYDPNVPGATQAMMGMV